MNQAGGRWNTAARSSSSSADGMRLPLSIMLKYETEGARRGLRWMQRAESSSSVSPLRLRTERSLVPRK